MTKDIIEHRRENVIIVHDKAVASRVGLTIAENTTKVEWQEMGQSLKEAEAAVHWWIGDWANFGDTHYKHGLAGEIAKQTGFEKQTIHDDKWVSSSIESSRRREDLSWSHHREVAGLEPDMQEHFLDLSKEKKLNRNELRREIRNWHNSIEAETEALAGKYRVIYADPPWFYAQQIEKYGPAERHYPTLKTDEIADLLEKKGFRGIIAENAVWLLWTTSPKIYEALELAEYFDFRYTGAQFIWNKVKHNYGHYNSVRHEHLLIFVKGSCTPDEHKLIPSVQTIERTDEHSEKPEKFRQIIDKIYPRGNRLELFARKDIKGWDTWGNQSL